jgi:hypothetical protein
MNSRTLPSFWDCYRRLPASIRQACRAAFRRFIANPAHPGLQFHRLDTYDPHDWSVRVTRDDRAVGILEGSTITWVWVGNHQDFDRAFAP